VTRPRGLPPRVSAYLDGELTPSQAAAIERELARDAALRADLDEIRQLSGRMVVEEADVRAAQGIRVALRARLTRSGGVGARARPRSWWLPAVAALAVVTFVALRATGPLTPARPQVHVQAVAEQYALALDQLGEGQP